MLIVLTGWYIWKSQMQPHTSVRMGKDRMISTLYNGFGADLNSLSISRITHERYHTIWFLLWVVLLLLSIIWLLDRLMDDWLTVWSKLRDGLTQKPMLARNCWRYFYQWSRWNSEMKTATSSDFPTKPWRSSLEETEFTYLYTIWGNISWVL